MSIADFIRNKIPDSLYLRVEYFRHFKRFLSLKAPSSFTEKIQWLKLNNRKDYYPQLVDKYQVRNYISSSIGSKYLIPLLGVWDYVEDVDFNSLPNQFVLKTTHDSGGVFICSDKSKLDIDLLKKNLTERLNLNPFSVTREWPYKFVRPRIIAESLLICHTGGGGNTLFSNNLQEQAHTKSDLYDYKFFCFNGIPKFLKVDFGRFTEHHANYYDFDWKLLPFGEKQYPPKPDYHIEKPYNFDKMLSIARQLSDGHPFIRVDLYNVNGQIYFGELTFFPSSGFTAFEPMKYDRILGDLICLPNKSKH